MRLSIEAAVQHQYTPFSDEMKWRPTKAPNGSTETLVIGARRLSRWRESFYFGRENFISFARRKENVESYATPTRQPASSRVVSTDKNEFSSPCLGERTDVRLLGRVRSVTTDDQLRERGSGMPA